ncbi:acyltransferase 3 [Mycolicibacterium phlei]|uniref:Acyltransferase n=2 Tax=Mycolicibacterium phlei TaxID=1771 RepID=A0A5N5VCB0_MYCPH|nr:Acyltransferase family protein [Mycolicibacterium phlei]EID12807.1 acyltransferase 3 [Mycolicibacterium phlei RIVM601174]KAB7759515.1 acyltransferase [Mycolicibacterium phlei DSM 43239 = CCUG 21000]KXW60129.1 acyltransferase [Mycolicibacterium phlei DSM 43072]KXW72748.1 acyltransferase [Mycolicibacterium phlei DSM 43070]KXW75020.1 acyltransferase [Mycolicibacterium phlei DSM 43071]VEG11747.1 acyltransferase 3 [Mycobacteroides chelonae]
MVSDREDEIGGTRSFLPAVEGMRACAAIGVVVTHVAFQTGHSAGITGRLLGRFDLAVAVFFALSGFLLWRGHAAAARGLRPRPRTGHYLRSRIVRIMPGYLVAVVIILSLLPGAVDARADLTVWLTNLTLTQIYVPLTLTSGLTQMWSLSVEMAFYLALPLLALLARWLPVRARIPAIIAVAVASLFWVRIPFDPNSGHNLWNWPPAFFSWFAAGMVIAELTVSKVGWPHRLARHRILMALLALGAFLIAASPLGGNEGLTFGSVSQVTTKTVMGAVVAGALLAPLVLDTPDTPHRILGSTPMVTLGRWSYGLFVWHLAALAMVFPMIGHFAFNGNMPVVLALTLLFGFAIAAVSYGLIEEPCRQALRRWEYRHQRPIPPLDSSVTGDPEPVIAR